MRGDLCLSAAAKEKLGRRCPRAEGKPEGREWELGVRGRPPRAPGEGLQEELNTFKQPRNEKKSWPALEGLPASFPSALSPRAPGSGGASRFTCSPRGQPCRRESERLSPFPHSSPVPSLAYKHHPASSSPRLSWRQTS